MSALFKITAIEINFIKQYFEAANMRSITVVSITTGNRRHYSRGLRNGSLMYVAKNKLCTST
jgi:hypothetical protein